MATVSIEIPGEVMHATRMTPEDLKRELAIHLFREGKLSFGKARELAGMIVSDSSPLISLARIGELDLLHRLYGELLIPQAVWHDVVVKGAGQPGFEEVKSAGNTH
jgi:hypothetical protein